MQDYEKLGVFYLGREYDLKGKKLQDDLLLYDSRDLVTHAVVVGMTGSGKTGLCIDLIEEAAIDNVPAILIDPKGDLSNLLLTFPSLDKKDFLPWINPDDANRKGLSPDDFAAKQAELWAKGLGDWGQDKQRIQRLRDAADFAIYTPGSSAGLPVSILKSFAAPAAEIMEDRELLQDRISTTVSSLLGLLGIDADPLKSREHIFLSTIISQTWQQGNDLDLAALINQVQNPAIKKIGVLDIESFYPSKDRFELVMALNNLLASPGFNVWLEGEPLDINQILHTTQGKPRIAIFSIAHLGDSERMFFVSLLLNQVLGWMRTQTGTTSLRALLYMDEIFGYFPPSANPPSKKPLLTLLKQARAYGLGVVLATQNPVDLDYKGLSNTGTWFIGRLQTERDKARVLDGLEGAAAGASSQFNRSKMEQILAGLGERVFLMNNTHEDQPVIFQTRWCMSYLRGPLARNQIKQLMDPYKSTRAASSGASKTPKATADVSTSQASTTTGSLSSQPPALPPGVTAYYIPLRGSASGVTYQPVVVGAAKIRFLDKKAGVDNTVQNVFLTPVSDQIVAVDWATAQEAGFDINDLEKSPVKDVSFGETGSLSSQAKNSTTWQKDFITWLYGSQKIELFKSPASGLCSLQGESERDFRVRLQQSTRETRDQLVEDLRKKYAAKLTALESKKQKAQQTVDRESKQAQQAGMQTALTVGATLLGAFMGRKTLSASNINKAASAIKGVGKTVGEAGDVGRAQETVKLYEQQIKELNAQLEEEIASLSGKADPTTEKFETVAVLPKKSDISVLLVSLAWAPYRSDGKPAW